MTGERGIPTFQIIVYCYSLEYFLGVTDFYPSPRYLSGSNTEKPNFIWSVSW